MEAFHTTTVFLNRDEWVRLMAQTLKKNPSTANIFNGINILDVEVVDLEDSFTLGASKHQVSINVIEKFEN